MRHHLRLENLEAQFIPDGNVNQSALMLAVRSLSVTLSRDGLSSVIAALIPEEPLQLRIVDRGEDAGCAIELQATRMGFRARITVGLTLDRSTPGAILINVDPGSWWSPLDRAMLEIAVRNLEKVARSRPGIRRIRSGAYQLDLQGMIRDQLLDSSAPVRWDARLERIDASENQISVRFTSLLEKPDTEKNWS